MTLTAPHRTDQATTAQETHAGTGTPANAPHSVVKWVEQIAALTKPDNVVWCDGTAHEFDELTHKMVEDGTLIRLNPDFRPYSFLARSDAPSSARPTPTKPARRTTGATPKRCARR